MADPCDARFWPPSLYREIKLRLPSVVDDLIPLEPRCGVEGVLAGLGGRNEMHDGPSGCEEGVCDQVPVAAPGEALCTEYRRRLFGGQCEEMVETAPEERRVHVVGVASEGLVAQGRMRGVGEGTAASSEGFPLPEVGNAGSGKGRLQ